MESLDQNSIEIESTGLDTYVISDVHLDAAPKLSMHTSAVMLKFFESFFNKTSPSHILINGDFFDFNFCPPKGGELSLMEKFFGPSSSPKSSQQRLDQCLSYHTWIPSTFAKILDLGHKITYIPGNHDVDFHWKSLQKYFKSKISSSLENPELIKNFKFSIWYYWEKGRIYAEHGHRFDPDNALSHPVFLKILPDGRMEQSFGNYLNQYFCNFYDPPLVFTDVTMSAVQFFQRTCANGIKHFFTAAILYHLVFIFVFYEWILWFFGKPSFEREKPIPTKMEFVEGNITSRFGRPLLMFERLHYPLYFTLISFLIFYLFDFTLAGISFAFSLIWFILARSDFTDELKPLMAQGAYRIARDLNVKVVTLGHLHESSFEKFKIQGNPQYINTGAWVFKNGPFPFIFIPSNPNSEGSLENFYP